MGRDQTVNKFEVMKRLPDQGAQVWVTDDLTLDYFNQLVDGKKIKKLTHERMFELDAHMFTVMSMNGSRVVGREG